MKKTENFELNQWEKADRILMEDFNNDNAKIDAALQSLTASVAQNTAALGRVGDCKLYTTSYSGNGTTGTAGTRSLYFPSSPVIVIIVGSTGGFMVFMPGQTQSIASYAGQGYINYVTWSGTGVSWYCNSSAGAGTAQMNASGVTYQVLALLHAN